MDSIQIERYLDCLGQKLDEMQTKATLILKGSAKMMKSPQSSLHLHSIVEVVTQIYHGEDPWFALGCFLHDWWCYGIDSRQDLIAEPPTRATTSEEKRWAAFCAATVEELCVRISFPCPAWTNQPDYFLEQPWFYYPNHPSAIGSSQPHLSPSNAAISLLEGVFLITNTNFNTCSAPNPNGPSGQIKNYMTYWDLPATSNQCKNMRNKSGPYMTRNEL